MANNHDIHHIKTYFVFFFASACIVGILVYLYVPTGSHNTLKNDRLQSSIISAEIATPSLSSPESNTPEDLSRKRIILTRLLLKYQGQLESLRARVGTADDDGSLIEQIQSLQEKIDNLTTIITELTRGG